LIDTLFRGGLVVNGSGKPAFQADVAVSGERILEVGNLENATAREVIDISGKVIAPGFIDIHTHSDLTLISNPLAQSKIRQGVTTEVVGNCGFGVAPLPRGVDSTRLRAAVAYLDLDPSINWEWETLADYLSYMDRVKPSVNIATLVGHIPIHAAVVGYGKNEATANQINEMKELLRESLTSGAYGFSTGLNYSPVSYASKTELLGLAEVVVEFDSFFAWHMRNYGDDLMASVNEVIDVALKTGVRTQISHLVSVGERNWGTVGRALEQIDKANSQGAEISVDVYPYIAGNCPLSQLLPDWAQEGGDRAMRSRMKDSTLRTRIVGDWADPLISWNDVQVSSVLPGREHLLGQSITEIAKTLGKSGDESALDLLADMGNSLGIVAFGRREEDVQTVFNHPSALIGSDGQSLDPDGVTGSGRPHPRSYGCFPRFLHSYVNPHGISLERAIQISTSAVAKKLHLPNRGEVQVNTQADLVVFDPLRVKDLSTYDNPHQYPVGITHVMVNGELVIKNEEHLGTRSGKILRKNV
jgi:N-acyl-D-aspartate/D-glutamate deacylase